MSRRLAAVDAHAVGEEPLADELRAHLVQLVLHGRRELLQPVAPRLDRLEAVERDLLLDEGRRRVLGDLLLHGGDLGVALVLLALGERVAEPTPPPRARTLRRSSVVVGGHGDGELGLADRCAELLLQVDQRQDLAVRELERRRGAPPPDLLGAPPSTITSAWRQPATTRSSALPLALREERVHARSAPSTFPSAHRGDRAEERDLGDREGRRGADEGEDVGRVLAVGREDRGDHLRLVAVAVREERADTRGR